MNCIATIRQGVSKNGNVYHYILFVIDNKELGRIFIKETELPYYENLLK